MLVLNGVVIILFILQVHINKIYLKMFIEKIEIETSIMLLKQMPQLKGKHISVARGWWYLPKSMRELWGWLKKHLKSKVV